MTKPNSAPRRIVLRHAVAAALLLTAVGCDGEGLAGHPGQNAGATKNYVASLNFSNVDSAFTGPLECEEPARCGGASSVNIQIVPEEHAFRAPVDRSLADGKGHIVARITNLDSVAFHPYGLAPRDVAYLWVGAMASGRPRIAIFRISDAGQSTLLATAQEAGYCPDPAAGRSKSAVHVNATPMCAERSLYTAESGTASAGAAASNRLASVNPGNNLLVAAASRAFSHARGLWFSCSLGCCEARGMETQ